MKNVLISGSHGLIGYGIAKSLRMSRTPYNIIGISIYNDSVAPGFCDQVLEAPMTLSEGYIDWLVGTIHKYSIDILFPGFEDDVSVWSKNIQVLHGTGAAVVINNGDLIKLCKDKWDFYQVLKKNNFPYTIPSSLSQDFAYLTDTFGSHLLLKPRKGSASRGIIHVHDLENFDYYKKRVGSDLMVQPYIGDDDNEYTTSAFCDGDGGFYALMTMKRKLSKQGFTEKATVFESEEIRDAVTELCKIFRPIGPTNFQFRFENGTYHLLEINPRISSSSSIRSSFGYNEAIMSVEYFLDKKVPKQPETKKGRAVRYIEDFIFDE